LVIGSSLAEDFPWPDRLRWQTSEENGSAKYD
jgi:hypothetical protein